MCAVSNVGDDFRNRFPNEYPWWPHQPNTNPYPDPYNPNTIPSIPMPVNPNDYASKDEVRRLREEIEALKELLKAAKIYDEKTGQPDCEMDEKVKALKIIAESMGVDLSEVFNNGGTSG